MATLNKRKSLFGKLRTDMETGLRTKMKFCRFLVQNFAGDSKRTLPFWSTKLFPYLSS